MANAVGWIRRHPGILVLLVALVIGQLVQSLSRPYVEEPVRVGELPVVAVSALAVAALLAIVVVVVRVQLGNQLLSGVRARSLSLPAPESLPARYALADPQRRAVAGTLALVDVALLLLVQSTLRTPVLTIGGDYVDRAQASTAYVVLVVLISLILLVKLYRTGGPVLVLLLWWGLDRLVPTAGFLGAHATATALGAGRQSLPAVARDRHDAPDAPDAADAATERAAATAQAATSAPPEAAAEPRVIAAEPTLVAPEPTVIAADAGHPVRFDATVVAPLGGFDPTVVAPERPRDSRQDMTIIAPLAPHEPPPAPETDMRHEGTVIVPPPARRAADAPATDTPRATATNLEGPTIVNGPPPAPDQP